MRGFILTTTAGLLLAGLVCGSAQAAQLTRTYVSNTGSNSNDGTITAPCLTLAAAYNLTAPGGEIDILNPGDYGSLTISQAITICGEGTNAGMTVGTGATGILVDAGASDKVILHGLNFNGTSSSGTGVLFESGQLLSVIDCSFTGMFAEDIHVDLSSAGGMVVTKSNFVAAGSAEGIWVDNASSPAQVSVRHCSFQQTSLGLNAQSGVVDISDSQLINCASAALFAVAGATISAERCMLSGNGAAARAFSSGRVRLSDDDLFNNSIGISTDGVGVVSSALNNPSAGNGTAGAPTAKINIE